MLLLSLATDEEEYHDKYYHKQQYEDQSSENSKIYRSVVRAYI